jgi:uncharacterized protein YyaL (SSP411 family)
MRKFPHTEAIALALERYYATRDERMLAVVTVTLTRMANGGTYDQEAGGFFRYSTTRDWSVPHFEKFVTAHLVISLPICYTQAQTGTTALVVGFTVNANVDRKSVV